MGKARRVFGVIVGGLLASGGAALASAWTAIGQSPGRAEAQARPASDHWDGARFVNAAPVESDWPGMWRAVQDASADPEPAAPPPVVVPPSGAWDAAPASGLRVTWLGHSTMLIEVDGARFLTDPVWSERPSPVSWAGPRRFSAPVVALDSLPPIDGVLISHDHYDHLDHPTVVALAAAGRRFFVPPGVDAHLRYWGVPDAQITVLDWWESATAGGVEVVATPARHASGRLNPQANRTLWAGWALRGPAHRVYFSGDTGLFDELWDIGARLGPFDLTLIEAGAYGAGWPDWHLGPEQAVEAHQMVQGRLLVPVHWGLFNLAMHAWTEPAERVIAAAAAAGVEVAVPRVGEAVEPAVRLPLLRWWPTVPTLTASEDPIRSRGVRRRPGDAPR